MIAKIQRAQKQKGEKREKIEKNVAFAEYKQTDEAKALEETIIQCRRDLTGNREELKRKTETINVIKGEIDQAKTFLEGKAAKKQLEAFHASKDPGFSTGFEDSPDPRPEMIDEEELTVIKQLKDLKRNYRENFNAIKELKGAINYSQQAIDNSKQQLVRDFEIWYDETFEEPAPKEKPKTAATSPLK